MKQLLVLSGKGGTGKTTISNMLIELFQAEGFADCDVDAPNLHLLQKSKTQRVKKPFFGLKKAEVNADVCIGCGICQDNCAYHAIHMQEVAVINRYRCEGCSICERLCPLGAIQMVDYEAGMLQLMDVGKQLFSTATLHIGSGNSGLLVTEVKKQITNEITQGLIVIDGSPGIGCPVIASLAGVDYCLMVAEPTLSGFSDLKRIVQTAKKFHPEIMVCINKYDLNETISKTIESYCVQEELHFIGKIPYDDAVITALNKGKGLLDTNLQIKQMSICLFEAIKKMGL